MKKIIFFAVISILFSCSNNNDSKIESVENDTIVQTEMLPGKDSLQLSFDFLAGNWKMVWVVSDDIKLNPKTRKKILNAKVFFKFNTDSTFFYIQNKTNTEGKWSIENNQLCVLLKNSKKKYCTDIKIENSNKISFVYPISKKAEADVTLSRVTK